MLLKGATLALPCHITAATLLPLHPNLSPFTSNQHTHFPSPPSFCFILRLLVKQRTVFTHPTLPHSRHPPPSPGTLTKHTPGTPTSLKLGSGMRPFQPRSASSLSTIVRSIVNCLRLAYTKELASLSAFLQTNFTAIQLGLFFFRSCKTVVKRKSPASPRRRSGCCA